MTFPIEMPTTGASLQQFEPQRVDFLSPEAGGRIGAVAAGNPLWGATWQIGKIGPARSDEWRAFVARMRGPGRTFLARDLGRPYPLAHLGGFSSMVRADGTSFSNGNPSGWSQTIDAEGDALLTLTGVPVSLALSLGDYIGFTWGGSTARRRTVARVVVPGIATAGGAITVTVEPPVPTLLVPSTATSNLTRPAIHMRLVPGEVDLGPIDRRLAITSGKVTAIQDLR